MNYADKQWHLERAGNGAEAMDFNVMSYYEELEEDGEVCNVWATDMHFEDVMENLTLILKAPDMYRLLKECEKHLKSQDVDNILSYKISKLIQDLRKQPEEFLNE